MARTTKALLLGIALLLVTPSVSLAADCQFVLGFKLLRDLIGHDIVGDCLDNEHYNAIGDSNQHTTGGLLAWRKADNWTAFTDGYRTWVNGPNGLQQRLNTERFEWEADYAAIAGQQASAGLTRDALRNAEYTFFQEKVRLSDGFLSRKLEIGQEAWQLHDPLAFGDLDNDGVEDAAVVLSYNGGGSGTFFSLLAILNENGAPLHVASIGLGDRIRLNSLEIAAGVITVKMVAHGPNDALCCPTQETTATFRLNRNTLELLSEAPPGNLTAISQRQARPTVDPSRIDPDLADAFQRLRQRPYEEIDTLYDWFVASGARAQFGSLEGTSQFDSSSNLITINAEYRNESPEALAHALIWPLASLHAISERGGLPRSWDECIADRLAAHSAQAFSWFTTFGRNGKQNPTELEQWANGNLASYLDKSLGSWVREAYRESCAYYGEPPPIPKPTPAPVAEYFTWPWSRVDEFGPEARLHQYLTGRGLDRSSTMYRFFSRALRVYAYSAYPMYLAYLDATGGEVRDVGNTENWDSFFARYLGDSNYRSEVHSAIGNHMRTAEYLGPILTTYLKGEIYGSQRDKSEFLSLIGTARVDEVIVYVDGRNWEGECSIGCQDVKIGLWDLTSDYDIYALERLPNSWKK